MRNLIVLFLLLFVSCISQQSNDYIVLTCGLSENPHEPRFGIEISSDSIFFCKEKTTKKREYDYFKQAFERDRFKQYINLMKEHFFSVNQDQNVLDGVKYELIFKIDSKIDTFIFYRFNMTRPQNAILDSLLKLQDIKFEKSTFHYFPDKLLKEVLPPPPPRVKGNSPKFIEQM